MPWTAPGGGTAQSAVSGGSSLQPGSSLSTGASPGLSTGASTAVFRGVQDGHRYTGLDLGPMLDAVPCARGHTRNVLREWAIRGEAADAVELVVSELVTNAVQAAQRLSTPIPLPVRLRLTDQAACVLVEVADGSPGAPLVHQPGPDGDSGRGLVLIATVSAGWGYYASDGIWKVVWATVALDQSDEGIAQRIENDFPGRTVTHHTGGWSATAPGCERIWAPTHQALRTLLSFASG